MERICRYICLLCVCFMALQMQANRRKVMESPGFRLVEYGGDRIQTDYPNQ